MASPIRLSAHKTNKKNAEQPKSSIISVALLLAGSLLLVAIGTSPSTTTRSLSKTGLLYRAAARNTPIRTSPSEIGALEVSPAEYAAISKLIQPPADPKNASPSLLLHVLRVHGLNSAFNAPYLNSGLKVLAALTSATEGAAIFGEAPVVQTAYGLRFPTRIGTRRSQDRFVEDHRDQVLASLAELGIPLDHPICARGYNGLLRDVLADSIANFHLAQKELPWTAIAYSLYLPPLASWTNRFGDSYSFDDIVRAMTECRIDRQSCGGVHLFYALTVIGRVDRTTPILSDKVRLDLWAYVSRTMAVAVQSQQPDGSWHSGWNNELLPGGVPLGRSSADTKDSQLLMTGHIAEWMLYLPPDCSPPERVIVKAAQWLKREILSAAPAEVELAFCPFAHGTCFLRTVVFVSGSHGPIAGKAAATNEADH